MSKRMMAAACAAAMFLSIASVGNVAAEPLASSDGTYEVELPDGYVNLRGSIDPQGDEQDFLILAGHEGQSPVYLLSVSEMKGAPQIPSLAEYAEILTEGVMASDLFTDPSTKIPLESFRTGKEIPCMKTCFTAGYGSLQVDYYIYALEGETCYYQFCAWTTAGNAAVGPELDAIVSSFTLHK